MTCNIEFAQIDYWTPRSKAIKELLKKLSAYVSSERDITIYDLLHEDLSSTLGAFVCQDTDLQYIAEVAKYFSSHERGLREWEAEVYFLLLKNNKIVTGAISKPIIQRVIEPADL